MKEPLSTLESKLKKTKSRSKKRDFLQELADRNAEEGNFKVAYEYYQQCEEVKDAILNDETQKQIAKLEAKYKTEQKEREKEIFRPQLSESLNSEKPLIFELHLKNNLWDSSDALKITVSL